MLCHPTSRNSSIMQCSFLEPFRFVTDYFQGQKYPTLGAVSRLITMLLNALLDMGPPANWELGFDNSDDIPEIVRTVKESITNDMSSRWQADRLFLGMAALANPAHKSLDWLTAASQATIEDQFVQEVYVVGKYNSDLPNVNSLNLPVQFLIMKSLLKRNSKVRRTSLSRNSFLRRYTCISIFFVCCAMVLFFIIDSGDV